MVKRVLIPISILFIVAVALIIARETREVVALVSTMNPQARRALLWFLLALYALCILVPIVTVLRLPRGLAPPSAEDAHAQKTYLEKLARRLCGNKNLSHRQVTAETVDRALAELGQLARQRTVEAATIVFVSTAVCSPAASMA